MEERSSSERKSLLIKTILIVILLLLALLSTVLYVFLYPKTTVYLYDDYQLIRTFKVKKYSKLSTLPTIQKEGYTFINWTYEDGEEVDTERELDSDYLSLYANYSINSYRITYNVQVLDPITGKYVYKQDVEGCESTTYKFGEAITLPDGKVNGELREEFLRRGLTFRGWTTKVYEESDSDKIIYPAGQTFYVPAGNTDLYAYWEKNDYQVILYTGIEYEMEGNLPKRDENNEYIIKNDLSQIREVTKLKYLDNLSTITDRLTDMTLDESIYAEEAKEYKFMGWYLDPDYTIKASDYVMELNVDDNDIPYLKYYDGQEEKSVYASLIGDEYKFQLYSKWERISYTLSFNKNTNRSSGKVASIQVYNSASPRYGQYYDFGILFGESFNRADQTSASTLGKAYYYHTLDLSSEEITSKSFLESNNGYRFVGWTTNSDSSVKDNEWYYQWTQSTERETSSYENSTYKHSVSSDVTLYAQWSKIYTITFADSTSINKKTFYVEGIEGEWFTLPGTQKVVETEQWTKDYSNFAGWTPNPNSELVAKYYEKNSDGSLNTNFKYTISRSNAVLYAIWEKEKYTITFYLNYGGGQGEVYTTYSPVYGGSTKAYPSSPTRTGYIFDGWSLTQYPDNTLSKTDAYTSAKSFKVVGNADYYASWTMNYQVTYNAHGGSGALPTSRSYSENFRDLKMTVPIGSGNRLEMAGHNFKGWVLKGSDGSLNTDVVFSSGNSVVFDYVNNVCYLSNNPTETYPIYLEGSLGNTVTLYAYWEPKEFDIKLIDTLNDDQPTVYKAKYGQDFTFPEISKEGYKFSGWAVTRNGTVLYAPGAVMPGSSVITNYTFYSVYTIQTIELEYWILNYYGDQVQYTKVGNYTSGTVNFGAKIYLPTPTSTDYGNDTFEFSYWYYLDGDNEVKVYNEDIIQYEGDKLILWAKFEKQQYTIQFEFTSPTNNTITTTISEVVEKGSAIDEDLYNKIIALAESFASTNAIKEYSFSGLYNDYSGNYPNPASFAVGKNFNATDFPSFNVSKTLKFKAYWEPNEVKFVYRSSESDYTENSSYHTGLNYESTSTITLQGQIFDMGEGINITRWYMKNSVQNKYFDIGANLIGGEYNKVSDLAAYITWVEEGDTFVGYVYLYAETEQVFEINYYRFNGSQVELIESTSEVYDSTNSTIALLSGSNATYGDLKFNGWRVNSMGGELIKDGTLSISPTKFPSYKINLYADMSFDIIYTYLDTANSNRVTELKRDTINYHNGNSYVNTVAISSLPSMDVPSGYTYYGLKYNDVVYSTSQITSGDLNITYSGNNHTILVYLTTTITVTYTVGTDETFADGTTDAKTFDYSIGYDGVALSTMVVENVKAKKSGYVFSGYSIKKNDAIDSSVYVIGDTLNLTEDTTFVAVFTLPTAGNITAYITYSNGLTGDSYKTESVEVRNGKTYTLVSGDDLSWNRDTYQIIGWTYDGNTYNFGDTFEIPLTIDEGDVFVFTAIWDEKYTLNFDCVYTEASNKPSSISIVNNTEYKLSTVPYIDSETVFKYWTYTVDGQEIIIKNGDTIIFNKNALGYNYEATFEGTIHTFPTISNQWNYTFTAVWDKQEFTLTLIVTDPNTSTTHSYTQVAYYGDSFDARELLDETALSFETDASGIIGWSETDGGALNSDIILNIKSDLTLYAVWSTKLVLSYAEADTNFGYKDDTTPEKEYYFANELLTFKTSVIKNIYKKGVNTVYYENGNYIVYTDNPSSTEYYAVVGYKITYTGGSKDVYFDVDNYTFVAPDSDSVLTPIFEIVYKVDFYENGSDSTKILDTEYVYKQNSTYSIDLSGYTASRTNYNFVGWNTDPDAQESLTSLLNISSNTNVYAVWESKLVARFRMNGTSIFTINFDKTGKIPSSQIDYYLSLTDSPLNNYLNVAGIANNPNTYRYNNLYYYLNGFIYNSAVYSQEDLCNKTFTSDIYIDLDMKEIYVVEYSIGEVTDAEGDINTMTYIMTTGELTSTGTQTYTLPEITVTRPYYYASGWTVDDNTIYAENKSLTTDELKKIIASAINQTITLYVNWTAKSYNIQLNLLVDSDENLIDPYSIYSNISSGDEITWTQQNQYAVDISGNAYKKDGSDELSLTFGTTFYLSAPSTTLIGDYTFIGWSTEILELGEIPESYYMTYYSLAQVTIGVDLLENLDGDTIRFYPVYGLNENYLLLQTSNGYATYNIEKDPQYFDANGNVIGFVHYHADHEGTTVTTESYTYVPMTFFNKLTVVADKPYDNYKFEKFTGVGTTSESENTRLIAFTDLNDYEASSYSYLVVSYIEKTLTIEVTLAYTNALKTGTDTSVISIGGVALNASTLTGTITISAVSSGLEYNFEISDNYKLKSVTSGTGDNAKIVSLTSGLIKLSELYVDGEDSNILITLTPKTYTINFVLNSGKIGTKISISNESYFVDSEVELTGSTLEVVANSVITLPTPTRDNYEFIGWQIDGADYEESTYTVTKDVSFNAMFVRNIYTINYYVDGKVTQVSFVGGSTIYIGAGVAEYDVEGKTLVGWTDNTYTYANGQSFNTSKKDYTFYAIIEGEPVTIIYNYGSDNSISSNITHEYGKDITLPTQDELENSEVENMNLYGWQVEGSTEVLQAGETISFAWLSDSYVESLTLNAVYYVSYTFTVEYDSSECSNVINSETHTINAKDQFGVVASSDLMVNVSSTEPKSSNSGLVFAGYEVYFDEAKIDHDLIACGGILTFNAPSLNTLAYTYKLVPTWVNSADAVTIDFYITNPEDTSTTLKLTQSGEEKDSITTAFVASNKLTNSYLPTNNYTSNWAFEMGGEFTADYSNFVAWKLIGFSIYSGDTLVTTIYLSDSASDTSRNIAGYSEYSAYTIWEERYFVNYYDNNGDILDNYSAYYDKNTSVKLLNKTNYYYEKDGYIIVGFADSLNKEIGATTDYLDYEYTIDSITSNYSLYPAFAKLYTINFSVSEQALIDALGDASSIHIDLNKSLTAYVGFGEIQIDDYFVVSYNGQGYEFKGYRLSDTIYNEDSSLLDGTYYVDPSDADENGVITIYAVWERLSYNVTFHVNARKNDTNSTLVSSTTIELTYLYNQALNEHEDWSSVVALQTLDYFNYTDMSVNPDGSTTVTESYIVTSDGNIYINFDPVYRLKYTLTEGATVVDGYELPAEKVIELGDEVYCELDYNNVFLNGSSPNYWYAENNRWVNFFESDPHVITASDLANSDSDYIINLLVNWSQANYTVNLYYIDNVATLESRYSSSSDGQIIATNTDSYITATLTAGDVFYYLNDDSEVASPFDNALKQNTDYETLYDLLMAFENDGFTFTGSISINNASTISASDYVAQTYNGGEAYSHDIYLIYQPANYKVIVANVIVDSELNFVSFSDTLVSFVKINDAENPSYLIGVGSVALTKYDTLTRVELTNIVISNNQNYKLVGWYSATNTDQMYDESGYFNNSYVPAFVDLLSVDGITSVGTDSYMFTSAFTIFALYQERIVDINVTIESDDSIVDDLSAKVYINGTLDTTSATVVDGVKTISIKDVKFGQTVKIAESISNASYELKGFRYNGTFLNITEFNTTLSTLYVGEITEFNITIVYKLKDINLYFKTSYGNFKGSISSITYTDKNGSTQTITDITSVSNTYSGLEYNLYAVATYGSVISSSFAVPVLNNYTFTGWKVNGSTFESLTLTDTDYYFEAVYEAVDVTVQFYNQEGQIIDSLTISDKKYGDSIILPYAIIDLENSVSTGWDFGEWGEEIQIYTTNNSLIENNTLKITAVSVNKYYIIFANAEGYAFDISAYPQTRISSTLYVVPSDITIGKNIEYTIYSGTSLAEITNTTSAITTLYSKSITLPDIEVPNTSAGIRFVTWVSEIGRELGANKLYTFFSGDVTDEDTQIITMYTKGSDLVDICFYITNPLSEGETYTLYSLSDMDETSALDFFPVSFNINSTSFADSKLIDTVATNGSVISWSNDEKRYFTDGSDNILETYEFIGWSTAILSPVENPAIIPFDDNVVLLYNWDTNSTKRTVNNDACSELYNIIKATDSDGNVTLTTIFYAVWEVKRTVTFDASGDYENSFVETYKYGNGVEITMPNPTTIDLRNGNNKWIGWTDGAKNYLFDDGYTFIVPTYDISLTPLWTAGVNVYFDTNFDSSRTYFVNTMEYYYSSVDSGIIGIPNITDDGYVVSETKTINNINFASIYKEGDLWAIGSEIDLSKYSDSMFSHIVNDISVYAGYSVNGREKYFYLAGWELNGETYDSSYTITEEDIMNGQDLTFKAIWKPVDMTVGFYYDNSAVETRSYKDDYTGLTISVTVPFGYMYTNKDYSAKGNYIYLYKDYDMSSVPNNLVSDNDKQFYRFMWWADSALTTDENVFANEKTDIVDANTVSRVMADDIKLYPVFYEQYKVEFRDTNNNLLDIQNDTNYDYQYVIDGEDIVINNKLSNLIDTEIIRKIYYLDSSNNNVTIYDRSSASNISDTLAFSKSGFNIINNRYIRIFVDIEITVNAYVPNASNPSTAVTLYSFEMVLNTICDIGSISDLSIGASQLSAYGDVDFDGWYFGENAFSYYALGSDSYLINESLRLDNIKISVSKSSGKFVYTLYNNSDEIGKVTLGSTGLVVNIFAKLLTTTTITLKGNSSNLVLDYAELEVVSESETSNYQIIEASTRTITYQTVYYGGLAPEINVNTIYGYTIDYVSNNVSTDMTSLFDDNMNVSSLNLTSEFDYFTVDYKKSTTQVSDDLSNLQLEISSSVVFRYIKKNNMTFEISVAPVSYTITYSYDPTEAYLVYKTSNTTSETLSFGSSGSIEFEYPVYDSVSGNEENRSINYTSTDSTITFTNVPYGISLYIIAKPVDEYLKHFSSWIAESGVGVFKENYQTYIPTLINNQEYKLEFNISAEMLINEISNVKLILNFKKEDYQANSLWADLLESAREGGFVTVSGDNYSYEWGLNVTTLKNYVGEADQDWNNLFVDILSEYNSQFNNRISNEAINGEITSISDLLNYFWFNNVWYTESSDKNCILDSINKIYSLHNATVTLYTDMTRAVVVSMAHETLDYKDTSKVIGVDRADYIDYTVYLSSNGNTSEGTAGEDYFIFNTAKDSISGDSNSIKDGFLIKMPFAYTVTATIQPNDSYKLEKYVYSTGAEKSSLVKKENDNSISVDTTTVGSSIQFYDSYPEIHIIAQVVIETIDVNFFDGEEKIATVKIAYDKAIYDGNHSMYAHYSHTLNTLRTDANFNMPLFDLDSLASTSRLLFNHSNDDDASSFGQYKYLLSGWSGIGVDEVITTSIDLTAVWYENKMITYHVYTEGGIEESLVYYLPEGDQTLFGNTYSESLAIASAILNIYDVNNKYEFEYKYNASEQIVIDNVFNNTLASYDALYKKVSSNDGYKKVSTVTDLNGDYNVYPSIRYNIQIQQNGSDFDKLTITTFGGKYILSMSESGYLLISNIINGEEEGTSANMQLSIGYEESSMYSFAYWEMSDGKDLREASSLDYFNDLTVNSHYNPKIVYKTEDLNKKGTVTVSPSSILSYLPLFTDIPSKQLLNGGDSAILKYSSFGDNKSVLSVIINGSTVYDFTYTYTTGELQKLFWQITFANSNESVILQEVNKYTGIKDENGLITIEPVVYGADATFEIDGFVITNLEDVYTEDYVIFTNNYSTEKVKSSESIYFETSTTESVLKSDNFSEICIATFTTTFNTNVNSNITHLRWQYYDASNGKWIDVIKGNTFVNYYGNYGNSTESNPVMLVRLACEWIEVTVEFAGLNSKSKSDFTSTSYNGFDFGDATNISSNITFINNSSTETTKTTQTLTLFKGDTITYNPVSETFVIESIGSGDSITISINIGSKYFSQGWFAYSNKNLSLISSSSKVYTLESTNLNFVAWVENKVSTAVLVDTDEYDGYTNGYGDVTITVKNAKSTNEIECSLNEYTYANLTLGESSKVTIVAKKSNIVNHAYIQMTYNSLTETSNTLSILGSKIGSEVKILFDAEDTKGRYILANEIQEVLVDATIYSGYTISYAEANNIVTITIKDMFGFVTMAYEIGKMPNSGKTYTPRDDYYINNIYRDSLSTITTTTKSGKTVIDSDISFDNVISDGSNLTYINSLSNSVIVDIFDESPYNLKIYYTINTTDVNGKVTTTTTMSESTVYWKNSNTENEKSNYLYIQDIKDATSKYIALRYNLEYSCIEMEVSKTSGTYTNKLLFNSKYNLISVSLENITCEYPQNITDNTSITGEIKKYESITLAKYTLVITLQEKSDATLYFKSTLPYENDLRNLNVFTWSDGNETNQTLNGSKVVFNSMNDNGIATAGITVPINSTIEYAGSNAIKFYNSSGNLIGTLKFTMNTNMYTYLAGNTTGWFVDTGDGYNIYSTDTYTIGGYSYGLYTMSGSEVGISSSSTITLTGDACIVLGLNRQEVKITIDQSYWKNNYGTSALDSASVFAQTASGTTYTVPGGLVLLLPAKSTGESTGETSYVQENNNIPTPMSIDNIRQYLYLSVEDSDSKARATKYIGGSSIEGNLLSASSSSTYINPGYAILGKNGEYNVELNTSSEWRLVVIPTGTPSTEVNIYSGPYGKSGITATTFNFVKDGTIDLQISTSKQSIDSFTVYLSQNYLSRLYEGMSLYSTLSDGHYNLSTIIFNGAKYITDAEVTAKSDKARRALTGYTIMIDGKSYTNLSYTDGLATLSISSASTINIYPIWEVIEAYTVTIDNSNSGKYINGTLVTGLTNVITGSAVAKRSYEVAFGESVTLTQDTGFKSTKLTYNVKSSEVSAKNYYAITSSITKNSTTYTYMFMGFTTDSSNNRDFLSGEYSSYGMYRVVYSGGAYTLEQNTTNYKNSAYSITVTPTDGDITLYPVWKLLGYKVTYEWNDEVYYCTSHPSSFYDSTVTYSTYLEDMPFLLGDGCDTSTGSSYFKKDDFYWTYSGSSKTNYVTLTSNLDRSGTGRYTAYYDVIHSKCCTHNSSSTTQYGCKIYYIEYCCYCSDTGTGSFAGYNHSYGDPVYEYYSEEQHKITKTCTRCGDTQTSYDGHSMGPTGVYTSVTCTEDGLAELKCDHCTYIRYDIEVTALGHYAGERITVKEPTCGEKGKWEQYCINEGCGKLLAYGSITQTEDHKFGSFKIYKSANCITTGNRSKLCKVCGQEYDNEDYNLPDFHNFVTYSATFTGFQVVINGQVVIDKSDIPSDAICRAGSFDYEVCSRCGKYCTENDGSLIISNYKGIIVHSPSSYSGAWTLVTGAHWYGNCAYCGTLVCKRYYLNEPEYWTPCPGMGNH